MIFGTVHVNNKAYHHTNGLVTNPPGNSADWKTKNAYQQARTLAQMDAANQRHLQQVQQAQAQKRAARHKKR